jgi:hypothetical protein
MNSELTHFVFDTTGRLAPFAAQLVVQSALLIGGGLLIARLCRRYGPALESVILRTALVMVILCPLVSVLLGRLGFQGRQWELPGAVASTKAASLGSNVAEPAVASRAEGGGGLSVSPETNAARLPLQLSAASTAFPEAVTPASVNSAPPATPAEATRPVSVSSPLGVVPNDSHARLATVYAITLGMWAAMGGFLLLRLAIAHGCCAKPTSLMSPCSKAATRLHASWRFRRRRCACTPASRARF